jgi:hypothetical protein
MIPRKKKKKEGNHMRAWRLGFYFMTLMALHMLIGPKQIIYFINTLAPNNELKSAHISYYWPQEFLALTSSLKHALDLTCFQITLQTHML